MWFSGVAIMKKQLLPNSELLPNSAQAVLHYIRIGKPSPSQTRDLRDPPPNPTRTCPSLVAGGTVHVSFKHPPLFDGSGPRSQRAVSPPVYWRAHSPVLPSKPRFHCRPWPPTTRPRLGETRVASRAEAASPSQGRQHFETNEQFVNLLHSFVHSLLCAPL